MSAPRAPCSWVAAALFSIFLGERGTLGTLSSSSARVSFEPSWGSAFPGYGQAANFV